MTPKRKHFAQSADVAHLTPFMLCGAMQARPMSSCGVCPSVDVSFTFVDHVKTNKHIRSFSPSGSHAILVFPKNITFCNINE